MRFARVPVLLGAPGPVARALLVSAERTRRALGTVAVLCCPLRLMAQARDSSISRVVPSSSRGVLQVDGCAGQRISNIVILNQPPYTQRLPKRVDFLRRAVRVLHSTTKPEVIQRYLLLKVGDPCNQIRRAESERILRAQPFFADARITVYDDGKGGVLLEVTTRDEFSLIFSPRIEAKGSVLTGLRIGDNNLGGGARQAAVEWKDGRQYHDVLGLQYTDYQFGAARQELRLRVRRPELGQEMRLEIVHPYYTDLQRYGWIASVGGTREYTSLLRPDLEQNAVNITRQFANIGGVARIGPVGQLKLLGALLTREVQFPDSLPALLTPEGLEPDPAGAVPTDFRRQRVARINALMGLRRIRFQRVEGFDALVGAQDVRVGLEAGFSAGQSLLVLGGSDRDRFVSGNIYAGYGGERSFVGMQAISEARYDMTTDRWDSHVTSARVAWYAKPAPRQLTLSQLEFASGVRMQSPFQLSLNDPDGGLIGYHRSQDPGARRAVLRVEQRLIVPTRYTVGDLGFAAFAEAGKLWAGATVPYSVTTPVRSSLGFSILAAVPPGSRRLYRVDFGFPVGKDVNQKFEIRFSSGDQTRVFYREPRDVVRARERTIPRSLFTWP